MKSLKEIESILALQEKLSNNSDCQKLAEPPFERLRQVLDDSEATELDRAILLRHALRYGSIRYESDLTFSYTGISDTVLELTGIYRRGDAGTENLSASPWCPEWLGSSPRWPADETTMAARRRRFFAERSVLGDPFLSAVGLESYKSNGQRDAIRYTLSMPPGASVAIDLPTGEGKSGIFLVIDKVGFATEPAGQVRGTTLVIVPTVTLALDHERNYGEKDRYHAYVGGDTDRNSRICDQIDADSQGLCFASPESAVDVLCKHLRNAACRGTLRAIVIDEAHLVESWGTGFRTEFQTVAGSIMDWKSCCPKNLCFRTIFLSATLSSAAERSLADLFTPNQELPVIGASRVRPEIEYWVAKPSSYTERMRRVIEALMHLPRPTILYVTKVTDANSWFQKLKNIGFGRISLVHGGTPARERQRILDLWFKGKLDLVVATSAFGLGIDYPHVRAVVHACIPESFDRFYQEAGRVGRDGCGAISLLIPSTSDLKTAKGLAKKVVISVPRGLERWNAMFREAEQISHPQYRLKLNVAPTFEPNDIDMVGERSIDWNLRTLALMSRAKLIRLSGNSEPMLNLDADKKVPYMNIEVVDESHRNLGTWEEKIEPKRVEILHAAQESIDLVSEFLSEQTCPGKLTSEFYSTKSRRVAVECGGCKLCRNKKSLRISGKLIPNFQSPWPMQGRIAERLNSLWGKQKILVVFFPLHNKLSKRDSKSLTQAMRKLDLWGLRIFVNIGSPPNWIQESTLEAIKNRPWIMLEETKYLPAKFTAGSRVIVFGATVPLHSDYFTSSNYNRETIFFIPEKSSDGHRPDRRLSDILSCKMLSLQDFYSQVLR